MAAASAADGRGHENARSVLLDVRAYSAASKNASTARSMAAHVVAATEDLLVVRVPINDLGNEFLLHNDYFVYRAHHQDPKLDRIPHPWPFCFGDDEIAVLSCGGAGATGGDDQYVVAALAVLPSCTLHLYRSKPGGETGSWTSRPVSLEKPVRDSVCPVPNTAQRLLYHKTAMVITLGGAKGTVGWVDLWRGILLCVLEESPKLQDMPLPWPAKGNWGRYLCDSERFFRDITVSRDKDSIKYVEMEVIPPRWVATKSSDPATFLEWVRRQNAGLPEPTTRSLVPGQWKATVWSMPVPVTSWDDWHPEFTASSHEFHVGDPRHCELLQELMSSGGVEVAKEGTLSLGFLRTPSVQK